MIYYALDLWFQNATKDGRLAMNDRISDFIRQIG